ncbi:MAG: hypothetical protein AAFX76_05115 [Planctomycetota bacterium]
MNSDAVNPSVLRRLRKTPLRDLLRGQLTGRLDLDAKLASSGLSPRAGRLVSDTVRRTRLWRLEKAAVADELIAHFRDGRAAGATDEELAERYGDPAAAAKLIGRAKRRSRSLPAKAFVWSQMAAAILIVLYAGLALRFFVGAPQVKVDYVERINAAALAVPEDQRAWPTLRAAWIEAREIDDWDHPGPKFLDPDPAVLDVRDPSDPAWGEAEAFLDRQRRLLDAIRGGAAKPRLGFVAGFHNDLSLDDRRALGMHLNDEPSDAGAAAADRLISESLIGVLLPHLGLQRDAARLLTLDTWRAVHRGDADHTADNLRAMLGLAHQSIEQSVLINGLVGVSIFTQSADLLEEVLALRPGLWPDDQLQAIARDFAGFKPRRVVTIEGERMFMYDTLQRLYTDDGRGDGRITDEGIRVLSMMGNMSFAPADRRADPLASVVGSAVAPGSLLVVASRRETRMLFDRLMDGWEADYARPLRENVEASGVAEVEAWGWRKRMKFPTLTVLLPALDAVRRTVERAEGRRDGVLIGVALERYRLEHDRWPADLAELTPAFLPVLPVDRITGGPLRYRLEEGRPVIYSVGGDRDDDGGRPAVQRGEACIDLAAFWSEDAAFYEGDWVIWSAAE